MAARRRKKKMLQRINVIFYNENERFFLFRYHSCKKYTILSAYIIVYRLMYEKSYQKSTRYEVISGSYFLMFCKHSGVQKIPLALTLFTV